MAQQRSIEVHPLSCQSLYLEMYFEKERLASGTAFVVKNKDEYYLITNRHNVRGRNNETDVLLSKTGAIPNKILVFFSEKTAEGIGWFPMEIKLLNDNESPIWFEHPTLGGKVDIVAIKLPTDERINYCPYSLDSDFDIKVQPSDYLSVIGFPFSKASLGYLAIWSTGYLATDIQIDYKELPRFLIDCRTRKGQSGSPVIICRNAGTYMSECGDTNLHTDMRYKLLGIYSSRISKESDLGYVWKTEAIKAIIHNIHNSTHSVYKLNHFNYSYNITNH